jgi:hypothetical protein
MDSNAVNAGTADMLSLNSGGNGCILDHSSLRYFQCVDFQNRNTYRFEGFKMAVLGVFFIGKKSEYHTLF